MAYIEILSMYAIRLVSTIAKQLTVSYHDSYNYTEEKMRGELYAT